jgi:DNA-binding transcriptional LysR family regulator
MRSSRLASVDLNLLVACDALLEERSVTRAAKRLKITQSAASHTLSRLRELFGDPLLVRAGNAMVLSERAARLVEPVRDALDRVTAVLEQGPTFDPKTARRQFSLSTSDYGELVLLPALVERLTREAPNLDLAIIPPPPDSAALLRSGGLDLGLGPITEAASGIVSRRVFEDRFVCVVRAGHPLARQRLTLEQYLELGHLLIAPRSARPSHVDVALSKIGRTRRVVVVVPHFLIAPFVVARSNLVLTLPARVAKTFSAALSLVQVEPPLEVGGFTFRLFWHEQRRHDAGHAWLRDLIHAVCNELE